MKKSMLMLIVMFSSVCSLALAYEQAEEQSDAPPQQYDEQQSDRPMRNMQQDSERGDRQGMTGGKKMGMGHGGGMQPTVVATNDGGVVVLMGNKLAKYDSELNLIGEVEMKGGPKPKDKKMKDDTSEPEQAPAPTENNDKT